MNLIAASLVCILLATYVAIGFAIASLRRSAKLDSDRIDTLLQVSESCQRSQFGVNEECRRSIKELYGAIEISISRVGLECSDKIGSVGTESSNAINSLRVLYAGWADKHWSAINQLGELSDERAESAKQALIDIGIRFEKMEQSLKIKTVEVGDRNQSRSKPWSEIRTAATQGAAKQRERETADAQTSSV